MCIKLISFSIVGWNPLSNPSVKLGGGPTQLFLRQKKTMLFLVCVFLSRGYENNPFIYQIFWRHQHDMLGHVLAIYQHSQGITMIIYYNMSSIHQHCLTLINTWNFHFHNSFKLHFAHSVSTILHIHVSK